MKKIKKVLVLGGLSAVIILFSGCILEKPTTTPIDQYETIAMPTNQPIETPVPTVFERPEGSLESLPQWVKDLGITEPVGLTLDNEQSYSQVEKDKQKVVAIYMGEMSAKITAAERMIADLATLGVKEVDYSPRKNGLIGILANNLATENREYSIEIMANESMLQISVANPSFK